MRVVRVEPHVVEMRGFELRTFQCVGCGDVEKRPVFDSGQSSHPREALPQVIAAQAQVAPESVAPQGIAQGITQAIAQDITPPRIASPRAAPPRTAPPPAPPPAPSAPVMSSRVRSIIGGLVRLRSPNQ